MTKIYISRPWLWSSNQTRGAYQNESGMLQSTGQVEGRSYQMKTLYVTANDLTACCCFNLFLLIKLWQLF
jgi:hypothetical protein